MVALEQSRNPEKLKKVIAAARAVLKGYYGVSKEEKEQMVLNVMYKFEVADKEYPISCYAVLAKKEIDGWLLRKTAKKRMQQRVVDGKVVYIDEISLNVKIKDDEEMELGDLIPEVDSNISMFEYLEDVKKDYPDIYPLLRRAMNGEELTVKEFRKVRDLLKHRI